MTYTEKELDQFLHGISLSLLSKKSAQHWRYDEETAKEIEWLEVLERKVRADKADRKTENSSEFPNNCKTEPRKEQNFCGKCRYLYRDFKYGLSCYRLMDNEPCKYEERKDENNSEKPNNCEHITEDGVTCAKYPACDDCLDNPLNKVKGSERLVKGSEQTEPTSSKMEQVEEPQNRCKSCKHYYEKYARPLCRECDEHDWYEPQTDCAWR